MSYLFVHLLQSISLFNKMFKGWINSEAPSKIRSKVSCSTARRIFSQLQETIFKQKAHALRESLFTMTHFAFRLSCKSQPLFTCMVETQINFVQAGYICLLSINLSACDLSFNFIKDVATVLGQRNRRWDLNDKYAKFAKDYNHFEL